MLTPAQEGVQRLRLSLRLITGRIHTITQAEAKLLLLDDADTLIEPIVITDAIIDECVENVVAWHLQALPAPKPPEFNQDGYKLQVLREIANKGAIRASASEIENNPTLKLAIEDLVQKGYLNKTLNRLQVTNRGLRIIADNPPPE